MSFPRYPEYKDSGVEWLGEVPAHWETVRLKTVSTCNDEVLPESTEPDYEIGYVEISDVSAGLGIVSSSLMPFAAAPSRARRIVRHGDVIVSTVRTYLKAIASIQAPPDNMVVSTGFAVIRPHVVDTRYAGYLFQSQFLIDEVIARSVGVSYPAINASELMRLKIPLPGALEQSVIGAFLDRETDKIDALVAEQQNLIALLKEKRQALISHAVTKGLDPDVPMRDSGVAWLGEVPAHWDVKALKNVISRIESGVSVNAIDTPAEEGEIGVLKTSCVYRGWFDPAENKAVLPEEYERVACPVTAGTLIVSRMNTPDLVGAAGMVGERHPDLFLPDRLWQVHLADAHVAFIHYWTQSPLYRAQVQQVCAGTSSSMQNLAQDQFRAFTVALPPVREQTAIAAFLDREIARIDALVTQSDSTISLLQERRTALISAAVTGKIDVRHLAAAATDPTPEPA